MSFLGGPECSTAANPLAQFSKQTSADNSLQRDRLTSRQNPQLHGFRAGTQHPEDAAFQNFAQQGPRLGDMMHNEPFHLDQLRREAEHLERTGSGLGGGPGGAWAGEFAQQPARFEPQRSMSGFGAQDFKQFMHAQGPGQQARAQSPAAAAFQQQQSATYQRPMMYGGGFGMQRPMMMGGGVGNMFGQPAQEQYEGKGKGRIQELSDVDWEKQFEELSTRDKEADLGAFDQEARDAMEREMNQMDSHIDLGEQNHGDFENLMNGLRQEADAHRDMMADLENHQGDEYDQWKDFDGSAHDFDAWRNDAEFNSTPNLGTYMFEENNLFNEVPNPFEEGQKIMREGGNLSLAALAFEAAVQKDKTFTAAWVALGQAQAQNEKESPAMRALEHALTLDPDNLDALMGLAVSYTNEGYDSLAYRTLERWVSAKYPQLGIKPRGIDDTEELGFIDRQTLHDKVTAHFLQAAQLNPEGGNVDVDVQVGLGVLFYGSEDYDKAVDCFTAALNSHEHGSMKREGEEHLLWNRLGATLANSSRSEEAIEAYSRALELRPNFVRARYNLGVSCINLGVLDEAAAHLLGALSMHRVMEDEGRAKAAELLRGGAAGGNPNDADARAVDNLLQQNQSTNLYDTLRRVFTSMGRRDLTDMVGPEMDLNALRKEFDF